MAKKVKPYEDMNRNRTLPKQSSNNKNNNNNKNKNNPNKEKKNFENTTKISRIEPEHFKEEKTLDTSFLEGRIGKSNKKERDKVLKEKQVKARNLDLLKSLFFLLSFFCVILLICLIIWNQSHLQKSDTTDVVEEDEVEFVIDDNYLFVGDLHVQNLPLENFRYPHVVVSLEDMTTDNLLSDLQQKVYIYNPSVVILEVGLNDLVLESRIEDIRETYYSIIKEIHENRPSAHIYVESIYPINSSKIEEDSKYHNINNATIKSLNKELKDLANTNHCSYVDLYSKLSDEDSLNDKYSDDGILLNEEGYKVVLKSIKDISDKERLEH